MPAVRRAALQMQLCVLLWGFTAILGKAISLPAVPLVFWRMLLVTGMLGCVPRVWRAVRAMPRQLLFAYAGVGCVLSLHWLTFYLSIKLSNASVAATCMALAPIFVAVVEPKLSGTRFDPRELLLGVLVIPGVLLVAGGLPQGLWLGAGVGVVSAFFVAIFGALQKRYVQRAPALAVTALELGAGALLLALLSPLLPHQGPAFLLPGPRDALLLLALAVACTLVPFTLSVVALRHLSAFAAQLAVNLEPIYTMLIAAALFGEHKVLRPPFYAGALLIVAVVVAHALLAHRADRPAQTGAGGSGATTKGA
jgi:drug/metabolite transporter (DMT)-like permease